MVLCVFLYSCNKVDYCQTCNEIKSYNFSYTFLFSENFERTYNYDEAFCQYPDYMPSDVIVMKESGRNWENSRIKVCINLDSLSIIHNPIEEYLDDAEKYLFVSKNCKRKTLTKNKKTITFVEHLDKTNNILTLITYYQEKDYFLIRKKIQVQDFQIQDYELIEELLFA
jgi:hypothetical protein